jgi:hypothetical protein
MYPIKTQDLDRKSNLLAFTTKGLEEFIVRSGLENELKRGFVVGDFGRKMVDEICGYFKSSILEG